MEDYWASRNVRGLTLESSSKLIGALISSLYAIFPRTFKNQFLQSNFPSSDIYYREKHNSI